MKQSVNQQKIRAYLKALISVTIKDNITLSMENYMNTIKTTLEQRGSKYGTFEDNSNMTQSLMDVFSKGKNYELFSNAHKECVHMIFHKLARMVSGDPDYSDNPRDIAGYATLLTEILETKEKEIQLAKELSIAPGEAIYNFKHGV